jgi:methylmalonyl-CoA/ethylmalonyl-CoA epimerase
MKLEHIGIAVKDIEQSKKVFDALFGKQSYKTEEVASEHVSTVFYQTGQSKVELLQSQSAESAIAKYIDKKGEGIHHLAFEVDDIYAEIERMKSEGFEMVNQQPKPGADNKLIAFLHPKSTNGVLIELCQEIK